MAISENGLDILAQYTQNGREAVNMVQIAAGLAIQEGQDFIREEDLEWVATASQLSPRYEKRALNSRRPALSTGLP